MKKIISLLLIAALSAGAYFGYRQIRNRTILFSETNIHSVLPANTLAFFESRDMNEFQTMMADTMAMYDFAEIDRISREIAFFKSFASLAMEQKNKDAANDYDFVFALLTDSLALHPLAATKMTKNEWLDLAKELEKSSPKNVTKNGTVEICTFPEKGVSAAYCAGILIASTDVSAVVESVTAVQSRASVADADPLFVKMAETAGKNSVANLFLNMKNLRRSLTYALDEKSVAYASLSSFASWVAFDVSLSDSQISLNGYADASETYITELLNGQHRVRTTLTSLIPSNAALFVQCGLSDNKMYFEKLKKRLPREKYPSASGNQFLANYFAGEFVAGVAPLAGKWQANEFVLLSLSDSIIVTENLDKIASKTSRISEYTARNISVYKLPQNMNLSAVAGEFSVTEKRYACLVGRALLITETEQAAHELAGRITAGYVLPKTENGAFVTENFSSASSLSFLVDFSVIQRFADSLFTDSCSKMIRENQTFFGKLKILGGQVEPEYGMVYGSAFVRFGEAEPLAEQPEAPKKLNAIVWQTEFKEMPVFGPVIVVNPATSESEILLQAEDKKLYCYTSEGKLQWTAPVEGNIMGTDVAQIDLYKNGKYQFVFNTAKAIYIIDRKGRNVENYPVALPQEASAPMSVFDYDNAKDYRFFVPCANRKILLFNKEGKQIPDWNLKTTADVVTLPIQYLRLSGKDYILVSDGSSPYILDRRGNTRVRLKSKIVMSKNNPFFLLYNKTSKPCLITTDDSGYLKQIDFSGNVTSQKLQEKLSPEHYFLRVGTPQKPVYVFVDNGKLYAYDRNLKKTFETEFEISDCLPLVNDDFVMIYSPSAKKMEIFDARKSAMIGQAFQSVVPPCVGALSPAKGVYLLVVNEEKLICFQIE